MRRLVPLAILAGCGAARVSPGAVAAHLRAPPLDSEVVLPASFAPRDLHLLVIRGGEPVCETWSLVDDKVRGLSLTRRRGDQTLWLDVAVDEGRASPVWATREYGEMAEGGDCAIRGAVHGTADGGLRVGEAEWFGDAGGCEQAIVDARAVVTDLAGCGGPTDWRGDDADTFARLDKVLGNGGDLWTLDAGVCQRWDVKPTASPPGQLLGALTVHRIENDGEYTESWDYRYTPAERDLEPGIATMTRFYDDGTTETFQPDPCNGWPTSWSPRPGAVVIGTDPFYLDEAACRAERAERHVRARWGAEFSPDPSSPDGCYWLFAGE